MKNKYWVQEGDKHILFFEPYHEPMSIAAVYCEDDGGWCFDSDVTKHEAEYLGSDDLEMAKADVLRVLEEHYQDEANYHAELLQLFKEE